MTRGSDASPEVLIAARAAIVDRATARVVEALRRERVRPILLKGPALERRLYEGEPRPYVDVDLLVAPADQGRAEAVLQGLGYAVTLEGADVPPFDRELHARTWRPGSGPAIDLHRTLAGAEAQPQAVWAELSRETDTIRVDSVDVEVPAIPALAVLVALHAAHHGAGEPKPLADLSRTLERFDESDWAQAAELAERIAATQAFTAALALLPAGRRVAEALGLPPPSSVEVALRADQAVPLALHVEWLRQAPGARAKLALLLRLLFPPLAWMEPPPGTRRRRLALVRAYLARIAKLRHAPAALARWRSARSRRGAS